MIQKVWIGKVDMPILKEGEVTYYPVAFIGKHILLRGKHALLTPKNKEKYKKYFKQVTIDFGDNNIQECRFIREDALKEILVKTQQVRLTEEKKKSQNNLHKYLGIPLLNGGKENSRFKEEWLDSYDSYTKDIVENILKDDPEIDFRMCSKCDKYLPLTNAFFNQDSRVEGGLTKICNNCFGHSKTYLHTDKELQKCFRVNKELFNAAIKGDIQMVYESVMKREILKIPSSLENKENYLEIISNLYKQKKLTKDNITLKLLQKKFELHNVHKHLNDIEIYTHLFGEDFYLHPWEYKSFKYNTIKLNDELAKSIFNKYIEEHGIYIEDPLIFDYASVLYNCRLAAYCGGRILELVVHINDYKYPAYKYSLKSVNHYKKDENLLFDLKYLIESDLKLDINKIPLYITKQVLVNKARPLYQYIVTNKNGSIYYWIDKLYPGKFIEADFDINPYRMTFDSDTELFIHEILKGYFENILYNQRNTEYTITINGMNPDWVVFTDKGAIIIEYFGMYEERQTSNDRLESYKIKTKNKIGKYENNVSGYEYLFLYRSDIANDFFGVREKVEKLIEKLDIARV